METLRIRKGHTPNLEGRPTSALEPLPRPAQVAVLPEKIPFVRPKLTVRTGQPVALGTVLFHDKRNPRVRFLAPGAGRVETVDYGPRRVLRRIVIQLDETEAAEAFERFTEAQLRQIDRERLVGALLDGGLWPMLRALPFRDYPDPATIPPAIIVSLADDEPFQPDAGVYLAGQQALFAFGMQAIGRLAPKVMVVAHAAQQGLEAIGAWITHRVDGPYPAGDPGTVLYHVKRTVDENRAWCITGQDVLMVARLLRDGRYPTERVVAVGGTGAGRRSHVAARMGAPLAPMAGDAAGDGVRFIVGGVLRGFASPADGYLGYHETALNLLPLGAVREFLAFVRPGFQKPTFSRTFLSVFNRGRFTLDCNLHGELRPCVGCNSCAAVCPVDILPQLTYKNLLADDIEAALAHGLLDCVECGLCTYVCPSKIELCAALTGAKHLYYQEQTAG